jgi:nucleoside-diphosphate-sugar epimerase
MPCIFAHLSNEAALVTPERKFTCAHGKSLTWSTARRALGFKPEPDPQIIAHVLEWARQQEAK